MKTKRNKLKNIFSSGFTLVETLVAISIFVMSILGLMSILASGISDTGYAKKKMVASYLAQEGIECVRNKRDSDVLFSGDASGSWGTFKSAIPTTPSTTICPIIDSDFADYTREISKSDVGTSGDEIKIISTVRWEQGSGDYEITFSEDLFNWIE